MSSRRSQVRRQGQRSSNSRDAKLRQAVAATRYEIELLERRVLLSGNGTFEAAVNYAAGSDPYSVTVGDFNGDV